MDIDNKISSLEKEIENWKRRFNRERRSRKHSENLLEEKSLALWSANQGLEEEVNKRTLSLEDALRKLQEADEAKTNFLANISHELKTPLNSINILSSLMKSNKKGNLFEQDVKNLKIINSCGKYLVEIIDDILDISKIEVGQLDIYNEKILLKDLTDEIYEMIKPQAHDKNLEFDYLIDDIGYIYSDKKRIKQIIKNLLSNSLKFTEKGTIYFHIKNSDDNLKIIIKDDGIGIPKEKLEHIFDRFKQVDGSTTRKYGGTGLGLAICKELVFLLNGKISVSSEENIGSTFEVILPKNKQLTNPDDTFTKAIESNSFIKPKKIEKLYFINSDPVKFFKIFNEMKKLFDVIMIKSFEEIDFNVSKYIFISSSLIDNNISKKIEMLDFKLILFDENDTISTKIKDKIIFKINDAQESIDFSELKI